MKQTQRRSALTSLYPTLMILCCFGGIPLLGSEPPPSDAPPLSAVLVLEDPDSKTPYEFVEDVRTLSPERLKEARHLWAWSSEVAPRRWTIPEWEKTRWPEAASPRLQVAVLTKAPHRSRPKARKEQGTEAAEETEEELLWVVAGPLELWKEVPERLLPAWGVVPGGRVAIPREPVDAPWRLRVVSPSKGSAWVDVEGRRKGVAVHLAGAAERSLEVVDSEGHAIAGATLEVLSRGRGVGARQLLARQDAVEPGQILLEAVPTGWQGGWLVQAPGYRPWTAEGAAGQLAARIELASGFGLEGRVIGPQENPIENAQVSFRSWASGALPRLVEQTAVTRGDGRFFVMGLPERELVLQVTAPGMAVSKRLVNLAELAQATPRGGRLDLGDVQVHPGKELVVRITDAQGVAVARAQVKMNTGQRQKVVADDKGLARFLNLDPKSLLRLDITADGFLNRQLEQTFPTAGALDVRLQQASKLLGRFVDHEGVAVEDGWLRVNHGSQEATYPLDADGRFEVDLKPSQAFDLVLGSPSSRALKLSQIQLGEAGSTLDLGELRVPEGFVIRGRLVRATDGSPVAGARIWAPRPSELGPLLNFLRGDLVTTLSDADGTFEHHGLEVAPTLLRVDAEGLARLQIPVRPAPDAQAVDLGTIEVDSGITVRLVADLAPSNPSFAAPVSQPVARLEFGAQRSGLDRQTVSFLDGEAVFHHVPPVPVELAVLEGRRVLCRETSDLSQAHGEIEVICGDGDNELTGRVFWGEEVVDGGMLTWSLKDSGPSLPGGFLNLRTEDGLQLQQMIDTEPLPNRVVVAADGTFTGHGFQPGAYRVELKTTEGLTLPAQEVDIPETEHHRVDLRFAKHHLVGIVLDGEETPVPGAIVELLDSGSVTLSDDRGGFLFAGLQPGKKQLKARRGNVSSGVQEFHVPEGGTSEEDVILVLKPEEKTPLAISVRDGAGQPVAASLVVVEGDGGQTRFTTTDSQGQATVQWEAPIPKRLRAAANVYGQWSLGNWFSPGTLTDAVTLTAREVSASLRVVAGDLGGILRVTGPDGWDISGLFSRLGQALEVRPSGFVELEGLPHGRYQVSVAEEAVMIDLDEGDFETVEMR